MLRAKYLLKQNTYYKEQFVYKKPHTASMLYQHCCVLGGFLMSHKKLP